MTTPSRHERRLAARMRDPEFSEAYDRVRKALIECTQLCPASPEQRPCIGCPLESLEEDA